MKKTGKKSDADRSQRKSVDLVGIDFSTTATKVVRLKKTKDEVSLVGIDLLPAVDFGSPAQRLELPRNMATNYGCLAYSGSASVARMVNAPLAGDETAIPDAKLRELLNVGDDYRVSAQLVKKGKGRQDSSFLAAAIPSDDVRFLLNMFPSGPPSPASVEVAGLSFVSAFLHTHGAECANEVVCLVEAGESACHFVFLNKGVVALVGRFASGGGMLRRKVAEDLGVDEDLAGSILTDRSINVSTTLLDVMSPFFKQLSLSKDFIERHQGCRVSKIYVSGGVSLLPHWVEVVGQELHAQIIPWDPLGNIHYEPELLPADLAGLSTRFSAAIGAALGGLGES